jgi:ubiquinone/menaquinone biosynthesis C-methylase UbiE
VLDVGCGTGDNAVFLAKNGFTVVGVDIAPRAIELAKGKAAMQNVKVDFRVANALELNRHFDSSEFDDIIDSGLFQTLDDEERRIYVKEISRIIRVGGSCFMLCFSDKEPGSGGSGVSSPRRISKDEIRRAFLPMFRISYIRDAKFTDRLHPKGARAYITSATKAV